MTESQKDNLILFMLFVFQCAQKRLSEMNDLPDTVYFGIGNMRLRDMRIRVDTWVNCYSSLARQRGLKFPL